MGRRWRWVVTCVAATLVASCLTVRAVGVQDTPVTAGKAGTLSVTFLYMPPTTVDPTYHTAMWLEDRDGKLLKTLYVSQELSNGEYKMGQACPDWVKKAHWDTVPKSEVDAVTAPTPNVGSEARVFDLAKYGVAPGEYVFKFQMHVLEDHNVLFRAPITVGGPDQKPDVEMTVGPGEMVSPDQYVREVEVRYMAPK